MASLTSTTAEIACVQLRSCLVNLPPTLAEAIVNAGTVAQNIIVELQVQRTASGRAGGSAPLQHSIYVGWTGISSRRRPNAPFPTDGATKPSQTANFIEIDSAFARVLELSEGQKVSVILRQDPELVHTLNVEPLTSGDWEMIELHAAFLETNLQAQVRALPNPGFAGSKTEKPFLHPLTLHLSPTSTANVVVTSFTPVLSPSVAFGKLAPDAEVIVAPKSRSRTTKSPRAESRSVTGLSQQSAGARSGTGSARSRGHRTEPGRNALFLRSMVRVSVGSSITQHDDTRSLHTPTLWADESVVKEKFPKAAEWITVSSIGSSQSSGGASAEDLQKLQAQEGGEVGRHSSKVVARLRSGKNLPSAEHALLSPVLAAALGLRKGAGEIVRIEPAPMDTPHNKLKTLKIYPFQGGQSNTNKGLRIGGDSRADKEMAAHELKQLLGAKTGTGVLQGPLTDGMVIPKQTLGHQTWRGGLVRFNPKAAALDGKPSMQWTLNHLEDLPLELCDEIIDPLANLQSSKVADDPLPTVSNRLIGCDKLAGQVVSSIFHQSSVLLEGGMGAGKTSLATMAGQILESEHLFHVSYLDCRKLMTDETRVSTIKETLKKIFMEAWWGSQLGGKSLVIFDDLDKLCPAETELQVGGENARSRQLSELFASMVHQYCIASSCISIIATAVGKESLQAVLVGSHVVRDIISIKSPDKSQRRDILESLIKPATDEAKTIDADASQYSLTNGLAGLDAASSENENREEATFSIDPDVDFLDIAGKTDGYMPGDLVLLTARTRSEAIIRSIQHNEAEPNLTISKEDFTRALKGFIPVSLRNVALQSSSTTFDSIGGLEKTRKILLETLQYPTTYAPIFARCPLRLRSGLLLYGYPGCGKTLLASAVAGECGLNFISVKGPEILNKYIGASEKSVRDLFDRAEAAKPCVLFFDEFDSIAPKRGHDSTGVTDRVVNQLLTQMDGAEGLSGVYVLAATSRPDLIDPALLRPGRLDKSLLCDMPDEDDRLGILQALIKNLKVNASIRTSKSPYKTLAEVARRTEGYSGADLQAVVYNAHLEAVHETLAQQKPDAAPARNNSSKLGQQQELLTFQFGESKKDANIMESTGGITSRPPQLGERAALIGQLEELRLAKRKEKAVRRGQHNSDPGRPRAREESPEPIIQWKHIEASLTSTRRSIHEAERTKLTRIYKEFVTGRNGEMPTGQGSTEIGARSSLM